MTGSWKVFVVGGNTEVWGSNASNDTEKIDPSVSDSNCIKPSDYPLLLEESNPPTVDGVYHELIISCGGTKDYSYIDACYGYNMTSLEWSLVAKMNEGRSNAASIHLNHKKIWITGGFISNHGNGGISTNTTEILDIETLTFSAGPDLPIDMTDHCMARYNETHIFIASFLGNYHNSYLVDIDQNPFIFHALPRITYHRAGAGCAVLDMEINNNNNQ